MCKNNLIYSNKGNENITESNSIKKNQTEQRKELCSLANRIWHEVSKLYSCFPA